MYGILRPKSSLSECRRVRVFLLCARVAYLFLHSSSTLKGSGADDSSNQHVACLYLDDRIVTMSLTQEITYFDTKTGEPFHVIEGHRGPISSLFAGPDSKLYTTGAKGVICSWAPDQEELHFTRLPTNEAVADILDSVPTKTGIFFASNDDKVSYVDLESKSITCVSAQFAHFF